MQEWSLVSVRVEPRLTSRLTLALFHLASIFIIYVIKIYVRNLKRVSGNQPLVTNSKGINPLCKNVYKSISGLDTK